MIGRDGSRISLWQDMPVYVSANNPDTNSVYDVAVVGGGITGISTALLLQRKGLRCIVLEAANIGFGTTGGTTAHLNTLLDTDYYTIEKNFDEQSARKIASSVADAIDLIRDNINQYRIRCNFEETAAFLFSQDEKQDESLRQIYEASVRAGIQIAHSDRIPIPVSFRTAVRVEGQAKFHPLRYLYGIATAFEQLNGVIVQSCRVTDAKEDGSVHKLHTPLGTFKTSHIVYATHVPPGINLIHLRCAPWRSYAMAVKLADDKYPEGLTYDMEEPYHYYRTQEIDGERYLIAGGKDHKTGHEKNATHHFRKLESQVEKIFAVKEIIYEWSSQYYEPIDGLPFIGHLPGHHHNVFVASGFGGNGMVYSSVAAKVLTDVITTGKSEMGELLSPARIKPIAGFTEFVKHNADVVKEFAGQFFGREELEEFVSVAKGEGKVVTYRGRTIAIARDMQDQLHVVNPRCTHMKCSVHWNNSEYSWDCPCHGARYDCSGNVLNGPADVGLEKISLAALVEKKLK
jgi:glycine/D-amino acid oxidase-like deaminating enzyme/nitrite reductase/ring-hydroxylating ferredoxin subunit